MSLASFQRRRREIAVKQKDIISEDEVVTKYDNLKVDELKELAAERNIENYSKMKKTELIIALLEFDKESE